MVQKISIIVPFCIVDSETEEMTSRCLESFKETKAPEDEIILVDDASIYKHKFSPNVRNETRQGNAKVWNQGLALAKNDFILFSDNDIEAVKWREPMLEKVEIGRTGVIFSQLIVGDKIKKNHVDGCFFMVKRKVFDEIGNFDESYGTYFEDTDFFKRVMNAGYILRMATDAIAIHKSKGTINKIWSAEKQKENFEKNKKKYEFLYGANYPYISWL